MRVRPFEYHAAENLKDALEDLKMHGEDTKVLAGGTDLVLAMKEGRSHPGRVVSLHRVRELDYVRKEEGVFRIGALAKHADLASSPLLKESFSILCDAVRSIGSWQIRNVATIGGNLCTASPAADSAPALLALEARATVADSTGEEEVSLPSFFRGPGRTALKPTQLLKEIIVPRPKRPSSGCFLKLMRKQAVDLALVNVAFCAETDSTASKLARVAIALGGVAPVPIRVAEAEAVLLDLDYEEASRKIQEAARLAAQACQPISDIRASAEYRRTIVELFVQRAGEKTLNALFRRGRP
jgi:carbon-monoxide dehydrogenase medium subunit